MLRRLRQHRLLLALQLAGGLLSASSLAPAKNDDRTACPALDAGQQKTLIAYLEAKYKLSESISIKITADESLGRSSCYHRLTFEGTSSLKTWTLTMYLSPDRRYLTSDLLDTSIDPAEEERQKAAALMTSLADNRGASLGPEEAPVTIVEFSDFECPYCKGFNDILKDALAKEKMRVRVVFHHLPLSMHPWARRAAQAAACAQLQGSAVFWALEDKLFEQQSSITADNVGTKIDEIAGSVVGLNASQFKQCRDYDLSLGLVLRDINLASANSINATPTIFINGRKIQGVKSADELRDVIAKAAAEGETKKMETAPHALDRQTQ